MLLILFAWLYISIACNGWGQLVLLAGRKFALTPAGISIHPMLVNLTGLAALGCVLQLVSLFTGLGSPSIQLIVLAPVPFTLKKMIGGAAFSRLRSFIVNTPQTTLSFFIVAAMILLMASYPVIHPDTESYHYPLILWASQYGTVKGIVHISYLYGLQSSWFLLCGAFRFSFLGLGGVTFVNSAVMLWMALFVYSRISYNLRLKQHRIAFFWLVLMGISVWDFVQVRLTASSASPDYIAALFILGAVYLLLTDAGSNINWITAFFCIFAVTLKLSAIPALLLAIYALPPTKLRNWWPLIAMGMICMLPFMVRNYIVSGIPLYPSGLGNWWHPDWQYNPSGLAGISEYVTEYARTHTSSPAVHARMQSARDWIPFWWKGLSAAEQTLTGIQPLLLILWFMFRKKLANRHHIITGLLFAGWLFWFFRAPDPRFGIAYLLGIPAVLLSGWYKNYNHPGDHLFSGRLVGIACFVSTLVVGAYNIHRCLHFLSINNLLYPPDKGFSSKTVYYKQVGAALPLTDRAKPVIATDTVSTEPPGFRFRGKSIKDGFRGK